MLEIVQYLQNNNYKTIAITGGAGTGKSTCSFVLSELLSYPIYSIDFNFI